MRKSTKITLIFVLIFVIGILSFVTYINYSLNNPSYSESSEHFEDDLSFGFSAE
ncbi:hypothetical protein [Salinimicrobium flavum]|uniref:Uncharacterized protein n=1 Tax=Salinimicrobium flavum TaxID=1737065 RepID=A0ABW5IWN2_9FLAO